MGVECEEIFPHGAVQPYISYKNINSKVNLYTIGGDEGEFDVGSDHLISMFKIDKKDYHIK